MASSYLQRARGAARHVRRRLAGPGVAELEAELEATRRKLRRTRAELRRTRLLLAPELPAHVERVIERARAEHLTYLKEHNLRELAALVIELERDGREGLVVEAGTARGGSAIVLAAAKAPTRPMKVYDVFGMIPPPASATARTCTSATRRLRAARPAGSEATPTTATATTSTRR
jgi:hypothetical protein